MAWASFGPTPLAVCSSLEELALVVVERSRTGSASPRGRPVRRRQGRGRPVAQRGERAGRCTSSSMPIPPTSTHRRRQPDAAATSPRTNAITCCSSWSRPRPGARPGCGCRRAPRRLPAAAAVCRRTACWTGPGRRRARRGRWPAPSASAASAGVGASGSRSSRVTIAVTCCLVGPAAAGDRGLDLAGGVQVATGMPRRAAATRARPLTWAVPMTVRTLCWLKTRSTATASGAVPVEPGARSASSMSSSRSAERRVRTGSRAPRRRPATAGRPTSPVDHADTAAGQAGVDPEDAHGQPSVRTPVRTHASPAPARAARRDDAPVRRRGRRGPRRRCRSWRRRSARRRGPRGRRRAGSPCAAPSASTVTCIDGHELRLGGVVVDARRPAARCARRPGRWPR